MMLEGLQRPFWGRIGAYFGLLELLSPKESQGVKMNSNRAKQRRENQCTILALVNGYGRSTGSAYIHIQFQL